MNRIKKSPKKSLRRDRRMWSSDETKLLVKCVNKYGKKWAYIYKNYPLFKNNDRTQIDLKDKFRNIENSKFEYLLYTQDACPYCLDAKKILDKKNISYKEINVKYENRNNIFKKLEKKTNGYKYFPIIFKKNKFVGGFKELKELLNY
jgi:glutaredoxin 3